MFIILLIIILGAVYSVFDPLKSSFFPSCPFKSVTGLDCPGCGSQRAIYELLHLNFKKPFCTICGCEIKAKASEELETCSLYEINEEPKWKSLI